MLETVRKSVFLLLATLMPGVASTQEGLPEEEPAAIQFFSVELIVFRYEDDRTVGSEIFPPDPVEPDAGEYELIDELAVEPLQRRNPNQFDLAPVLLPEDQLGMQDVIDQLQRLDAYTPILHVGWIQPGLSQGDAVPMPVTAFGPPPAGLEGSFSLYLGRYLHLVVDLALTEPHAAAEFADESGAVREFEYSLPPLNGPVRYRIQEDRILKSGELRYFDHPKFGVLAKVLRVESALEQALQEIAR